MTTKHEYHGQKYWVTIMVQSHPIYNDIAYTAYVSEKEPDEEYNGNLVKDEFGLPLFFDDIRSAIDHATDFQQMKIYRRVTGGI